MSPLIVNAVCGMVTIRSPIPMLELVDTRIWSIRRNTAQRNRRSRRHSNLNDSDDRQVCHDGANNGESSRVRQLSFG
jgi:hypothetical protein